MKKVLVLSSSLRKGSNSEILAQEFAKGAAEAGNKVEFESLRGKKIGFCMGCLACQKKGKCVIKDDANAITEKMKKAEVIVFRPREFPLFQRLQVPRNLPAHICRRHRREGHEYREARHWRVDCLFRRSETQGSPLRHGCRKRRRRQEEFRALEKSVRHGKKSLTTRR